MKVICLDLEGVLVPEIWINVAESTGIEALRATTRDIPDYDELMRFRLDLTDQHGLKLGDIQQVIQGLEPFAGALDFVKWLQSHYQLIVLSDTFYEFAAPLMEQLGNPILFCHHIEADAQGRLTGYQLRMPDQKSASVRALQAINFRVVAGGDSFNDLTMLEAADAGIFFRPPPNIAADYPRFPVVEEYPAFRAEIERAVASF
ncbi:MAG: bifunctional phosphoserine phosphatase/homoserine phosphotransferase ThrH [Acidiferrobacteraceae bacterium]|jgi:phosphoserine/homoserine phosphotransferase|nr:bifunctional phosphoserine phosphatase/homoserine phosphotransferase ThrH [Acidiferrobacteraceae bacterium]